MIFHWNLTCLAIVVYKGKWVLIFHLRKLNFQSGFEVESLKLFVIFSATIIVKQFLLYSRKNISFLIGKLRMHQLVFECKWIWGYREQYRSCYKNKCKRKLENKMAALVSVKNLKKKLHGSNKRKNEQTNKKSTRNLKSTSATARYSLKLLRWNCWEYNKQKYHMNLPVHFENCYTLRAALNQEIHSHS